MRFRQAILVSLAAAMLLPVAASAQTDTSLRIRSLAPAFAGILDDFITDVYLNPARVAQLERPMAYMVNLPYRSVAPAYPMARANTYSTAWAETEYMSYGIRPIVLSCFARLGDRTAFSIGAEVDVTENEGLDESNEIIPYVDRIRTREHGYGSVTDIQHYLVDLTLGSNRGGSAVGGRIRAAYDASNPGGVNYSRYVEWNLDNPDQFVIDYDTGYDQDKYHRLAVDVELGLYRPGSFLRELVVTGSARGETFKTDSRDQGGRRTETTEYLLSSSHAEATYDSDRDYDGYGARLRAHLGWTERIRSTHAVSWDRSTGDGLAGLRSDTEEHDSISRISTLEAGYSYDGTADAVRFESTIGYFNNLFENVLFAFAVFGVYSRSTLDEDASGDMNFGLYDSSLGLDSTLVSPYRQNHKRTVDDFRVSIPVALEWGFHKYLKLRVGMTVTAKHAKDDRIVEQTAVETGNETELLRNVLGADYRRVESGVGAAFTSGLEINIIDRLVVDLLCYYTSEINLAEFGYVSVRYRF